MSQYSVSGYLSALEMRTSRTLLLEGVTDWQMVSRVVNGFVEEGKLSGDSVVIDTADLLDRTGYAMGVREFVEYVHGLSGDSGELLFAMVDREFRGFRFGPPPEDDISSHHLSAANCMWTRGHSIENYVLSSEAVIEYLRHNHPESVPASIYPEIHRVLELSLPWCGAVTLALAESRLLGRADGLARTDCWDCHQDNFQVGAYARELAARCDASFDVDEFEQNVREWHRELIGISPEVSRWVAHGHLSMGIIWATAATVLAAAGVESKIVEQIASGMRKHKLRSAASWWQSQIEQNAIETPLPLVQWLIGEPS